MSIRASDRALPLAAAALLACSVGGLRAQDRSDPAVLGTGTTLAAGPATWRVPIHTLDADPVGGEYGWWAVGAGYKVSFHDGFVFYPHLGPSYPENLPLRWTTASISVGGQPVDDFAASPEHFHTDWRYEYRWPNVTEAYDVREDGVEQLFVIRSLPATQGDLVVEGRLESRMRPAARPERTHAAIAFQDDRGEALVQYGAATALDALGRELPIETAFDGERVRLVVPATWLRDAVLPVTIDPLTTRVSLYTAFFNTYSSTALGRHEELPSHNLLVIYKTVSAWNDVDLWGELVNDDLTERRAVFADVAAWSSSDPDVAFVADADRWVLAFHRTWTDIGMSRVVVYLHDRDSLVRNSGITPAQTPGPAGSRIWYPTVGGSTPGHGPDALLVYHSGDAPSGTSSLWGQVIDASTGALSPFARISPATIDAAFADVSSGPGVGERSWVVAYEGRDRSVRDDDFDIYLTRVDRGTLGFGSSFLVTDAVGSKHKWLPAIDGRDGRYLLAMTRDSGKLPSLNRVGTDIVTHRIDWSESANAPTVHAEHVHGTYGYDIRNGLSLAYDDTSRSHWCLVHDTSVKTGVSYRAGIVWRFGSGGNATEQQDIPQLYWGNPWISAAGVVYRASTRDFEIVYGMGDLYSQQLVYPADAINVPYGQGCGSGAISALPPYAGSEFFEIRSTGSPPGKSCILLLSLAPTAVPLGSLGMPGCMLNVSPNLLVSVPMTSNKGGAAQFALSLPDAPLVQGDLFAQWVSAQPALNTLGFGSTQGLRIQVR